MDLTQVVPSLDDKENQYSLKDKGQEEDGGSTPEQPFHSFLPFPEEEQDTYHTQALSKDELPLQSVNFFVSHFLYLLSLFYGCFRGSIR